MNFDTKAGDWDKDPGKHIRAALFAEEILRITENRFPERALEFGCGTGLVSFNLKERTGEIILADTSEGMLKVLNDKILQNNITNMIPYHLNESNSLRSLEKFDLVYTLLTLHHVRDLTSLFSDFREIIKPGGWLILGDLYTEDGSFHESDPDFDGHRGFDPEYLARKLESEGFRNLSYRTFHTIEKTAGGLRKEFPLFILYGRKN
ncbi:MAG TPA: class I SAM-dependent methyltransferase [Bacteroidales bacterium]|nr:class I SAM-dependent methyltransferase [Bacteroidales bacterium]